MLVNISHKIQDKTFLHSPRDPLCSGRFYPTRESKKLAQLSRRVARVFRKVPYKFQNQNKSEAETPSYKDHFLPLPEPTEYNRTPSALHQGSSQPLKVETPPEAKEKKSRSISIHETPMPKNAQLPIQEPKDYIQESLIHVKLTEAKPPAEKLIYIKPPSSKSRRTNRKQFQKKEWRPNKIPTQWKRLAKKPGWDKLSKDEKMQLKLGWPDRNFCLSHEEIGKALGCSKRYGKRKMKGWFEKGDIEIRHEYAEYRGKVTKIHKRNYYVFTEQGKLKINRLLNLLHVEPKRPPLKNHTSYGVGQGEQVRASSASDEKNAVSLNPEAATIFDMFGFSKELPSMSDELKKKVNESPLKQLVRFLKWLKMKSKKKWRYRSFWGSFNWLMTEGIPKPWLEQRTEEYLKALAGEHTMDGVDAQLVVEQILELQEKTGLKATKRDLEKLLSYGAMHLKAYLKIGLFKHKSKPLRNWIGFTHHLAKQPAHELADWYKPKAPPKDETKLEWVKRYLKQNKKKLDFISLEASLNRCVKRETTQPSVLLQLHAKESKSVLKTFQKVRGQWVDRTFPLHHPDFKEVVATHFENCFKEVRVSNAKFFAERAKKNRPQKNLNWLKAYLTKQKDKVVFLKSEKQINREAQGGKTKPGILLKIHAEVEKSIFKVVQIGEWVDQEFHLGHPEFEKAVTAHLSQGMKA